MWPLPALAFLLHQYFHFVLVSTAEDMLLPAKLKDIYSVNEGNYITWDEQMQRAVDSFKFNQVSIFITTTQL